MLVILHNIRSLHNVGSIFRTADALGFKKIYLTGITPAPFDRFGRLEKNFAKVALGAEKSVLWDEVRTAAAFSRLLKKLKKDGYKILAVEQNKKSIPYYKLSRFHTLNSRLCLIMGNEVRGLPLSILEQADKILEIPMLGKKESLNVSIVFGIVAAHLRHGIAKLKNCKII